MDHSLTGKDDMSLELEDVACNLCGARDTNLISRKAGEDSGILFNIVRCRQCGLVYVNPRLTQECMLLLQDKRYDSEIITYSGPLDEAWLCGDLSFFDVIKAIKPFSPHAKLLDLATGTGHLVYRALKAGYDAIGIDISRKIIERVHNLYPFLRTRIKYGDINASFLNNNTYDVITATEALEHLYDPINFFKRTYELLKPGGVLAYTTGNVEKALLSIDFRQRGVRWSYFQPDYHIYYLSQPTILAYFKKTGLQPVQPYTYIRWYRPVTRKLAKLRLIGKTSTQCSGLRENIVYRFGLRMIDRLLGTTELPWALKPRNA
jgi:2-polyprenyl-3-methyl-5-hydroxy-6-metoxy-1,4-benzoquinol methylase